MRTFRQHPFQVLVAVLSGMALEAIASANQWTDAALYGAMTLMMVVFVAAMIVIDQREQRERPPSPVSHAPDGPARRRAGLADMRSR